MTPMPPATSTNAASNLPVHAGAGAGGMPDVWGNPGYGNSTALAPYVAGGFGNYQPPPPPQQPLKIVHRSLRGRYPLAITLGLVGAAVGALVGWSSQTPRHQADGFITIEPSYSVNPLAGATKIDQYEKYMRTMAARIGSDRVVSRALKHDEWRVATGADMAKATDVATPQQLTSFMGRLRARYGDAYDLVVTFEDENPRVAKAGVNATLAAFDEYRRSGIADSETQTVQALEASRDTTEREVAELERQKFALGAPYNTVDLTARVDADQRGIRDLEGQVAVRAERLRLHEEALRDTERLRANVTPDQLTDDVLRRKRNDRQEVADELDRNRREYGPNHPSIRRLTGELESLDRQIKNYEGLLAQNYAPVVPGGPDGLGEQASAASVNLRRYELEFATKQLDTLREGALKVQQDKGKLDALDAEIARKTESLTEVKERLDVRAGDTLAMQPTKLTGPISTRVTEDRRTKMAALGLVFGAGVPVLGVLLWGLSDRRYRYSDEATDTAGSRGLPLLGILPNLPDRLTDEAQAGVAAQCVHQIRTMLQLNCMGEDPTALSVTSAAAGDGKTSLSLALGLSFATSGSRTCLVDSDVVGAGLSARLGVSAPDGVAEALTADDLMHYVHETDVADLCVLPVGTGRAQQASAFSPTAARRLIAELKKRFDVIVIDTGPVLGSIEATPIVASCDFTILTVSRGQNRDLVEKALNHLRSIGSRVAGVVFNRAASRDFEKSINGMSLRSMARSAPANYDDAPSNGRLGPLAHSVNGDARR